jgi:hypothetical protein
MSTIKQAETTMRSQFSLLDQQFEMPLKPTGLIPGVIYLIKLIEVGSQKPALLSCFLVIKLKTICNLKMICELDYS